MIQTGWFLGFGHAVRRGTARICAAVLVLAFLPPMAKGQTNELVFQHLSAEQGLSHKNVHSILQDGRGFIWLGTKSGLNLYDGRSVQPVEIKYEPKATPTNLDVRALAEDNQGYVWIGTYDNGLLRLDPTTKQAEVYNTQNTPALATNTISHIHRDRRGNLWIATFGGGLVRRDHATQRFSAYRNTPNGLNSDNIITIHEDRQGSLWLGTFGGGLCRFEPESNRFAAYLAQDNTDIHAIEEDRVGNLWLGTYGKGLVRFDKKTAKTTYFSTANTPDLESNYIRSLQEDASGRLWIGTEKGGGLSYFDSGTRRFYNFRQNLAKPGSIASNDINTLMLDRLGVLWIGTEGAGVNHVETQNAVFRTYRSGEDGIPAFTSGAVTAIYEDRTQTIWIGGASTEAPVLYAHSRFSGTYTAHKLPLQGAMLTFNHAITAITEDNTGNIWVGTAENGLYKYDRSAGRFKVFTTANSALSSNSIEVLHTDKSGVLWIGTYEGGLCRFDPVRESVRTYVARPGKANSLAGNTVKLIYEDGQGRLWLGTKENGLSVFEPRTEKFVNYRNVPGTARSLPGNSIRAVAEVRGQVWVGTDAGIARFNPDNGTFSRTNVRNGLPENDVCGMLPDRSGRLWISTFSEGLVRFDPQTQEFRRFTIAEGLHSNEFQQWAAHRGRTGEMFFGGNRHFVNFVPEEVVDKSYTAPIYVTSFALFDKKVEFKEPLYRKQTIELDYKDNFFEFEFAFLNYLDVSKNSYAYMMEGVDKDWKKVGNRQLASYTNLDPGSYVFRVKAADKYNRWNEKGATIRIIIHPAWYQTWWARISAVAIVLGSILLYYRSRIRFFQRQKQVLEGLVQQRTAELVQKNAEIEKQKDSIESQNVKLLEANEMIEQINEELRAINNDLEDRVEQRTHQLKEVNESLIKSNQELDMFIYRASHDIKGPLASLSGLCKVAGMDVQDEKARDYFTMLDKTCDKANHTLVRILKMYDIRNAEIHNEPVDVAQIAAEYAGNLRAMPVYQNIRYEQNIFMGAEVFSDRSLASIVVTNLIENAFKYHKDRAESYVRVHIEAVGDDIRVRIHDNGIGVPEKAHHKLFTMFFRGTVDLSGTGLGLYLSKLAVERIGGSVHFCTDSGTETVFEAIFPKTPPEAAFSFMPLAQLEQQPAAE
ncbi:MAG: ATP-binding protein [Cytophagales bacterium]|nr:ATP-binding protein [Cytophagales bacterium]